MKIEYLYSDDSYKQKIDGIEKNPGITFSEEKAEKLNIFRFETKGNDENAAKVLSNLNDNILNFLEKYKLIILENEASSYFNKALYPHFNSFERSLRKLIFIASTKANLDSDKVRRIEEFDFGEIYRFLFCSDDFIKVAKSEINKKPYSKNDMIKILQQIQETTLWSQLVKGDRANYIQEHFLEIIEYRNDVMHAHNINYEKYVKIKKLVSKANDCLMSIINNFYKYDEGSNKGILEKFYVTIENIIKFGEQSAKIIEQLSNTISQYAKFNVFEKLLENNITLGIADKLAELDTPSIGKVLDLCDNNESHSIRGLEAASSVDDSKKKQEKADEVGDIKEEEKEKTEETKEESKEDLKEEKEGKDGKKE